VLEVMSLGCCVVEISHTDGLITLEDVDLSLWWYRRRKL